ncbi:MAG: hypothetical protein PHU25_02940 [Deltaproteobacteria bacterium]|nr:hypothetical protein [Deltaproteobacteria bacterium]
MNQTTAAQTIATTGIAVATAIVVFGAAPGRVPGSWHGAAGYAAWVLAPYVALLLYFAAVRSRLGATQMRISQWGAGITAAFGLILLFDVNGFTCLFIPMWQLCVCAVVATLNAAIK